ncbi:DoxX family protein [Spirosoma montaniterrae]|uniref:DoxX family protein n=1 Tax=Spirosoma montaniterrae TaxID=1178516 RepID=A0A1P9WS43_9BACT|nr:DoxX family protein [Spirosoma montaniterrae]AQG78189.1 hypothetical protein AWR27_01795 [Spirosoma montaniterrae]
MKTKRFILTGLLGLLSVQFGTVGVLKIIGFAPLYQQLATLHVDQTGGLLIGIAEVLGVIGLWIRPTRRLALLGLLLLSVSAIAIHVGAVRPFQEAIPATVATVLLLTALLPIERESYL